MTIYRVTDSDELTQHELEKAQNHRGEYFVYNYKNMGYEGSGFALWSDDGKFGYTYLGHCSCNGPLEDMNSILYTMEDIEKLANAKNYQWDYAEPVIEKMKELINYG